MGGRATTAAGAMALGVLMIVGIAWPAIASTPLAVGEPQCSAKLKLTKLKTRAGCYIDAPKRGSSGTASFRCRGGKTRVTLGSHTFTGNVAKGTLRATATSEFEFSDGCVWRTHQTVAGRLGRGELTYEYTERVVSSDGSCAAACSARGTVEILE